MRFLLRWILVVITLLVLSSGYLIWNNNRSVAPPETSQLNAALERGIQWLTNHRQKILNTDNPMLWYMVQQAGNVTDDTRLKVLFDGYAQRHLDKRPNNVWHPLFYPKSWVPVRFEDIANLPYYNWHFIYAYTCGRELAQVPEIMAQNDPAFRDQHLLSPACVTYRQPATLSIQARFSSRARS